MNKAWGLSLIIFASMLMALDADSTDQDCKKWNQTTQMNDAEVTTLQKTETSTLCSKLRLVIFFGLSADRMKNMMRWTKLPIGTDRPTFMESNFVRWKVWFRCEPFFRSSIQKISKEYNSPENKKPLGMLLILKGQREQGINALIWEADMLSSSAQIALHL